MQETNRCSSIPELERAPEEEMATLSSILAWRIPWTKGPGELQSVGSHRVEEDWVTNTNLYKGFINMKSPAFTNQGTSITLTHLLYSVESSPLEAPLSLFLELSLGLKSHGGKKKYSLWSYTWLVQNPPGNAGDAGDSGSIPRSGRSPGEGHGNPLQYLAWRTPWTEEPGGLQSMGSQRVRHDWATNTFSLTNRWHSKNSLETYLGLFVKFYRLMFIYPFPLIHLSISNAQTKSKNNLRYKIVTQQS